MNTYSYIAHSLNSPFTAILGFLDIISLASDNKNQKELQRIKSATLTLKARIDSVLAILNTPYLTKGFTTVDERQVIAVKTENLKKALVLVTNVARFVNGEDLGNHVTISDKVRYVFPIKRSVLEFENTDTFNKVMEMGYSPEDGIHLYAAKIFIEAINGNLVFTSNSIVVEFEKCPQQF